MQGGMNPFQYAFFNTEMQVIHFFRNGVLILDTYIF